MKTFILLLYTCLFFLIHGQYDLNIKAGFNNPNLGHPKYFSFVSSFDEIKNYTANSSGSILEIGMHQKISKFFSHKLVLSGIQRKLTATYNYNEDLENSPKSDYSTQLFTGGLTYMGIIHILNEGKFDFSPTIGFSHERAIFASEQKNQEAINKVLLNQFDTRTNLNVNFGFIINYQINKKLSLYGDLILSSQLFNKYYFTYTNNYPKIIGVSSSDVLLSIGLNYQIKETSPDILKHPKESFDTFKTNRKIASFKFNYLHDLQIQTFFQENPYLLTHQGENYYSCPGYCEDSEIASLDINSKTYGFALKYSFGRFVFPIEISKSDIEFNTGYIYRRHYAHPHAPFGYVENNYSEINQLKGSIKRIEASYGIGFNLIAPGRRLKIIPTLQWSNAQNLKSIIDFSQYSEHYIYKWHDGLPTNDSKWDSIKGNSSISINNKDNSFRFGVTISLRFWNNFELNYAYFKIKKTNSMFNFPNSEHIEYNVIRSYAHQVGIGYRIPFKPIKKKNKLKDILKES